MKTTLFLAGSLLALVPAATAQSSCSSSTQVAHSEKNIVETALAAGQFETLATALTKAGLVEALQGEGPFTVFAPTDAAFGVLPEGTIASLLEKKNRARLTSILTYHVVAGDLDAAHVVKAKNLASLNGQRLNLQAADDEVRIGGARIVKTDIHCSNGVIHVIDAVMLPSDKNIVGTAKSAGAFNTLVAAVGAAGLAEALSGEGPFTVFAPTDEAFAALPAGTVDTLLKPENKHKLVDILKYHVVSGRVYSDQLKNGQVATLGGSKIKVDLEHGVRINESTVKAADIETTNGVIHVIDKVLLP